MRAARGIRPEDIARESRLDPTQVEVWLAEDDLQELITCCREMMDLPAEQRLQELQSLALDLLQIALEERDVRVALFVGEQMCRGKNPARVLADAVNRKVAQAATPLDIPLSPLKLAAEPNAASAAARMAYNARPWAPAVSAARLRLTDEMTPAMVSNPVPKAEPTKPAPKPNPIPVIFRTDPARLPLVSDLMPKPSTSTNALLINHPRDGP